MRLVGWTWTLSLFGLVASGCPDDGGDDVGEAETGPDTAADGPTGPSTDPTADGSATGASVCGDVDDEQVGPLVTIRVANMRAEPVWLPLFNFCYISVPYTLTGPDGMPVPWVGPDCGTCQSYAQGNCGCPGAACSQDVLLYLEPGAVFERGWSGGQFVADTLPDACPGVMQCGASCQRAVQSPSGSYSLDVQAGATASGCLMDPCACEPVEGICTVFDPTATVDDPQPYAVVFEYPSVTAVEITID